MNRYEAQGMYSLLPGLQFVLDVMEVEVERMLHLADSQDSNGLPAPPVGMDEAHRSKIGAAARQHWKNMSPAQKRARVAAMNRGRKQRAQ